MTDIAAAKRRVEEVLAAATDPGTQFFVPVIVADLCRDLLALAAVVERLQEAAMRVAECRSATWTQDLAELDAAARDGGRA